MQPMDIEDFFILFEQANIRSSFKDVLQKMVIHFIQQMTHTINMVYSFA